KFNLPIVPIVLTGSHQVWDHPFFPHVRLGQEMSITILEAQQNPDPTLLKRQMKQVALDSRIPPRRYIPDRDGFWDGYRLEIDPDFPEVSARVHEHRANLEK
ncbi:MAG: 1-acyl-sn-glycerol-3-phosphate acyltransferase, partial [Deinococcales bacterium]